MTNDRETSGEDVCACRHLRAKHDYGNGECYLSGCKCRSFENPTTDLDALEALRRYREAELPDAGYAYLADALESTLAELRQERERADRAEWAAGIVGDVARESSAGWQDASALLSRAEETIEAVEDFVTRHYLDTQMGEKVLAILTEYDKQKGADRG